jgi:hypothetical protein
MKVGVGSTLLSYYARWSTCMGSMSFIGESNGIRFVNDPSKRSQTVISNLKISSWIILGTSPCAISVNLAAHHPFNQTLTPTQHRSLQVEHVRNRKDEQYVLHSIFMSGLLVYSSTSQPFAARRNILPPNSSRVKDTPKQLIGGHLACCYMK